MTTCYFQKSMGRHTGMRGVSPDFTVTQLLDVVHSFDELNGVSFRVVPD
jgi:hypothetical protein